MLYAAGTGRRHRIFSVFRGGNEDVVAGFVTGHVAVYEKNAVAVGRLLKLARCYAVQVAALLIAALHVLGLLIGPWPDKNRHEGDDQQNRPGKEEQRAQKTGKALAARKPDHHFAVTVHARQGTDHCYKKRERQDRRQPAQGGVGHEKHHILWADETA